MMYDMHVCNQDVTLQDRGKEEDILKEVYRGIHFFLISAEKHILWVPEVVLTGTTIYVLSRNMKNI